jgi:hypothetical protein
VRIAFGASCRSATVCMVVSRVGGRNLTLPERRSLSTSPWDLDKDPPHVAPIDGKEYADHRKPKSAMRLLAKISQTLMNRRTATSSAGQSLR